MWNASVAGLMQAICAYLWVSVCSLPHNCCLSCQGAEAWPQELGHRICSQNFDGFLDRGSFLDSNLKLELCSLTNEL